MTPQERDAVVDLFGKLASVEGHPRDPEAQKLIAQGLKDAPNAVYALVQTVLLQERALRDAEAHIREIETNTQSAASQGSFLDDMRGALFGRPEENRGSVPSVRPGAAAPDRAVWNTGRAGIQPQMQQPQYQQEAPSQGSSFLSSAAGSLAGVIGGTLLMNSMRSMMGGGQHSAFSDPTAGTPASPWGGNAAGSDLARQAGIDDIGRSGGRTEGSGERAGLFDSAANDAADDAEADAEDDLASDFDSGGDSDSDIA